MQNIQPINRESISELYFQAISNGNIEGVSELVTKYGVDVYSCDHKGRNLLHLAVQSKMFALVEFFFLPDANQLPFPIDRERLLMASDNDGKNILHYGVLCDNYRFFKDVLLKILGKYDFYKEAHLVQIGDLYLRRDRNNRKAIDYAVMFKKQNLVDALADRVLCHSMRVFCLQYEKSLHDAGNEEEATYQVLKQNLVIQGITMYNAEMSSDYRGIFHSVFTRSCDTGYVKVVKFFLEEDTVQLAERVYKNMKPNGVYDRDAFGRWMASLCVEGNINTFINFSGSEVVQKGEYLKRSPAMLLTLYDHIRRWNYTSTNKSHYLDSLSMILKRLVGSDVYFEMYVRMLAKRNNEKLNSSANTESRFNLLVYFASISLAMLPGIFPYFQHSQPQLFTNMMSKFPRVHNLAAKVQDDPQMVSIITQNSNNDFFFMRDANNRIVYNDMTICECLLIYAAITDRVNELEFCLDFSKHFKIGALRNQQGFNPLQWTAVYGSYITLKCSFAYKYFQKKDILANNVNTIALTVANGHQHVAEYLVHKLGNKVSFRGDIALIAKYYALTSSAVLTKVWHKSAAKIQALGRRFIVRKKLRFRFGLSFAEWRQYNKVWGAVVQQLAVRSTSAFPISWIDIKRQFDIVVVSSADVEDAAVSEYDHDLSASIDQITDKVVQTVVSDDLLVSFVTKANSVNNEQFAESGSLTEIDVPDSGQQHTVSHVDNIELSADVVKWVNKADSKYRAMFQSKIERLAGGDRSYALSKRLQHCDYPICETKLDDGMRILWTVLRRDNTSNSILVWFVSKHDKVAHFAQRICDSCNRLSKQPVVVECVDATSDATLLLNDDDVLIDPCGNCPLKVHLASRNEIGTADLSSGDKWSPPLKLSSKQRSVNDESGTVLLLGRSGTGKTICICERMIKDSRAYKAGQPLKQLFVCRSNRLCAFVGEYQQKHCEPERFAHMQFMTLAAFTEHVAAEIAEHCGSGTASFHIADKMDFARFMASFHAIVAKKCSIPASILWLHIRSFLKGSVEAVMQGRPLTLEQYLDVTVFGMDRCRLSVEDRREVYALFVRYEDALKAQGLWDDADNTLDLLNRSKLQPLSTQYDKVYVDEVQDNTQAEIVLYFLAAGMNTQSLFLAGDPAQSVVEGVDFRFEEVRAIVYKLSGGKQSIHRPMKLTVNYRSHSGVLSCASSVLSGLFAAFPASANVLPKDTGLFHGPRPACCMVDGLSGLSKLLLSNQRWSVLCLDDQAEAVQIALSEHEVVNIVLGVRAAKGLEFQDVVLLDFFGNIPVADHAVWKTIFTSTTTAAVESVSALHPEVELQLKLLYTAITRSCNRLIFVETKPSTLASVMFRWFTSQNITEMYQRNSSESAVLMTSDEWRMQGIEFALSAEGDSTAIFLEQAIKCFTQAKDVALLDRATAQLRVTQLLSKLQRGGGSVPTLTEAVESEVAAQLYNAIKYGFYNESKIVCQLLCDKVKHTLLFKHEIFNPLCC